MTTKNITYKGLRTTIFLGGPILMVVFIVRLLVDWNVFIGSLVSGH
ncbi:hypothetical protein [Pseudomonas serbica]|nr:hypothetical protein [Pseudomonas serbica]